MADQSNLSYNGINGPVNPVNSATKTTTQVQTDQAAADRLRVEIAERAHRKDQDDLKVQQDKLAKLLSRQTPKAEALRAQVQANQANTPNKAEAQNRQQQISADTATRNKAFFDQLKLDANTSELLAYDIEQASQAIDAIDANDQLDQTAKITQTYEVLNDFYEQAQHRISEASIDQSASAVQQDPVVQQNITVQQDTTARDATREATRSATRETIRYAPTTAQSLNTAAQTQEKQRLDALLKAKEHAKVADEALALLLQRNSTAVVHELDQVKRRNAQREQGIDPKKPVTQAEIKNQKVDAVNLAQATPDKIRALRVAVDLDKKQKLDAATIGGNIDNLPSELKGIAPDPQSASAYDAEKLESTFKTTFVPTYAVDEKGDPTDVHRESKAVGDLVAQHGDKPHNSAVQRSEGALESTSDPAVAGRQEPLQQEFAPPFQRKN